MSERRWVPQPWINETPMTDAEVLAEMGGQRVWVCFIDQRITNKKWCHHQASRCGYYQIVKEAADG